jgi:hypothetical protein
MIRSNVGPTTSRRWSTACGIILFFVSAIGEAYGSGAARQPLMPRVTNHCCEDLLHMQ